MENMGELGAGAVFAMLVIEKVFGFLKSWEAKRLTQRQDSSRPRRHTPEELKELLPMMRTLNENVEWLRTMHEVKDADGAPIWYNRRSSEDATREAIKELTTATRENGQMQQQQTILLQSMVDSMARERDRGR